MQQCSSYRYSDEEHKDDLLDKVRASKTIFLGMQADVGFDSENVGKHDL